MQARPELWSAYRDELKRQHMVPYLRTMAFAVFGINLAFIFLDGYAFPQQLGFFLPVRLSLSVILAFVFYRGCYTHPETSKWAICLATSAMLITVISRTGAAGSEYYVGLILLFVAAPVLLPLSSVESAIVCGIPVAAFTLLAALAPETLAWQAYTIHLVFLTSAGFLSIASSNLLDRVRFSEFMRRKELERARDELRELDRAKSRFTANIHHELRTPLTLILTPLEAMLSGGRGEIPASLEEDLRTMRSSAARLLKLINDLLELARMAAGVRHLQPQPVELGPLVHQLIAELRPLAERKRIQLSGHGLDLLPIVQVDPEAMEQVLVNLLGNALKFTGAGGRIEVRAEREGEGVRIRVSDSGIGIPKDQLERIFDRFAQVDASATRTHQGSGIGLSLAKELVELHGGWIRAESPGDGRGATMHVWLPLRTPHEPVAAPRPATGAGSASTWSWSLHAELGLLPNAQEASRSASRPCFEPETTNPGGAGEGPSRVAEGPRSSEVLVVEDNAAMRALLARVLSADFHVRTARDGREALDAVHSRVPTLVLTDVMMPVLSGTELCRLLKSNPATRAVPVILLTSKAEREMKIEGLELGADDYVTKPFHPRELLARVRSLVRVRTLQEELAQRNEALERTLKELKEAEVQLVQAERLAAVGELAAGLAHEVNNPVNFATNALASLRSSVAEVRSVAERIAANDRHDAARALAEAAPLAHPGAELDLAEVSETLDTLMGIVTEGLERTQRLVADLRDFGAPGRQPHGPVDLPAAIDSTLRLLRAELKRVGVRVETHYGPELVPVWGERGALNQLCLNLLKNAIQALEEKGGTIEVDLRKDGSSVVLSVRDDGPGIAPELQERLFEPFFTTKASGQGTGLGLSICRRIVEAHHGSIGLDSAPGQGSTFSVRLSAEASDASSA